jgi:4-hydroxy-2-oxoheptanedioate aldolase
MSTILNFAGRLRAGPTAFAAWIGLKDPSLPEIMLREGFDCTILDWQHGFHDFASILNGITSAHAAGKPALVRIGVGEFDAAARFLDWGAMGIIAPMINSAADAKTLVELTKYPPLGARSWGPARALGMTGLSMPDYLAQANTACLTIAMIETRAALNAIDDILTVEGIDGVLVGPSDLSIALSNGALVNANDPDVDLALTQIAASVKKAGKLACAFCIDGERAGELSQRGYHLLSVGTDQLLMKSIARSELAKARNAAPIDAGNDGY